MNLNLSLLRVAILLQGMGICTIAFADAFDKGARTVIRMTGGDSKSSQASATVECGRGILPGHPVISDKCKEEITSGIGGSSSSSNQTENSGNQIAQNDFVAKSLYCDDIHIAHFRLGSIAIYRNLAPTFTYDNDHRDNPHFSTYLGCKTIENENGIKNQIAFYKSDRGLIAIPLSGEDREIQTFNNTESTYGSRNRFYSKLHPSDIYKYFDGRKIIGEKNALGQFDVYAIIKSDNADQFHSYVKNKGATAIDFKSLVELSVRLDRYHIIDAIASSYLSPNENCEYFQRYINLGSVEKQRIRRKFAENCPSEVAKENLWTFFGYLPVVSQR